MRHPYLLLVCFFLLVASYAMAENEPEKTPDPTQSPVVSPTPIPTPELMAGVEIEGVKLVLPGPFHFLKDELGVEPVNVTFRVEVSTELKEVKLNTNPFKVLEVEICHNDSRDKIQKPNEAPADDKAFSVFLTEDSFYSGSLKNLEKYFDFEEGGQYWIRAKLNVENAEQKLVVSDWASIDIYTKACVTIKTREGSFTIWLRYDKAPKTSDNFMSLVKKGYYNNLLFHRVENQPTFKIIQGGCPHGDGSGGPGYTIPWEETGLLHEVGAVAMALSSDREGKPLQNSGRAQFYVCAEPTPMLDGKYCVFGKVIEGIETVKKISAVQVRPKAPSDRQQPTKPMVNVEMESLTIEYRK